MNVVRAALVVAGVLLGVYGLTLLFDLPRADLMSVIVWFAVAILLHDAVFAPLCAALGLTARRLLPATLWAPAACGAVCTVALLLVGAPVLGRGGAVADNPTVLDRDYPLGLTIAVAAVWTCVILAWLAGRARGRRAAHRPSHSTPTTNTP
ncbi:hypothetical protein [Nocardia arizonensis]|uniref:hypothetical protein n=1 Tax=Nocardia arizonensis TaxID=1141647 RepID=UPI000A86DC1A|nr:hypothetical protein [Nocardia arizonensis]